MNKTIRAIYKNGALQPLEVVDLEENAEVVLTFESHPITTVEPSNGTDPLARISFASGLGDLAQNFDDYRFGRKQ